MGDEIREEAKKRGVKPSPENLGNIMFQIREEEGVGILAERCVSKIKSVKNKKVVIDGIRSVDEIAEFKKEYPNFKIIGIYSSPNTRFNRLKKRGRSDDPKTWKMFRKREKRELQVGLGEVLATVDFMITNEGSKRELQKKVKDLIQRKIENE
jgi:dephospho-CoA kinase